LTPVLEIQSLSKRYGQITVADEVSFSVARGECLGVIGPNGAGKTSVFNLIDGSATPNGGRVRLEGVDVTTMSKHGRVRLGMARAYQVPQPFPDLSTFENVLVSATFGACLSGAAAKTAAQETLRRAGLWEKREIMADALPLLDRKRLELARALAAAPKLLLLDEIAGGLTQMEVVQLVEFINSIKPTVATIWIEHVTHALSAVADRMLALNFGRVIAQGNPAEVMRSPAVQEVYLGTVLDAPPSD
jgi:branched-chain amino acid transport system ATP-binding protein